MPHSLSSQEANKADSIIARLLDHKELYGKYIQSYNAKVYIKGNSYVSKKNFLYKYAPSFLYWDRRGRSNFSEAIVDIQFEAPNRFSQHIVAVNGSRININDLQNRVMQFLDANIYSPTIFDGQVLLPEKDVDRYYRFEYVNPVDTLGHRMHRIKVIPKIKSQKLVSGYMDVIDGLWTIFSMDIRGKSEFSNYRVETEFGLPEEDFLLPKSTRITFQMKLFGNEVINRYYSSYNYLSVKKYTSEEEIEEVDYDLSKYFTVNVDSIPVVRDSLYWEENRPEPLTPYESELYEKSQQSGDTLLTNKSWNFAQGLVVPKKFIYDTANFTYSGLLNPLKLSYTKLDGISYWQQFRLNKVFPGGQELQFRPNIGYLFQRKELYFNTPIKWIYNPRRIGEVSFNFGNKNRTYASTIIGQIENAIPDSLNFKDFNIDYYRHYKMELMASYEIANGLLVRGGINYDWYDPVKKKDADDNGIKLAPNSFSGLVDDDIVDLVSDSYKSFAPTIEVIYTPKQYYRINGKKKEYVGSHWPTFSLSYARGIEGILNSNSHYERLEFDVQQKIPIGLLNSFQYYIGFGGFTNNESTYFANYAFFQRKNFPHSWNDPIGGVFHLLDRDWYSATNFYTQAHFMYESPFVLLRLFRRVSKDILAERIYLSQLYTPSLPCYTEAGYGIGNFIGNVGVFVSFNKGKYESFGVKASFELGK